MTHNTKQRSFYIYDGASENHHIISGENQPSKLDWRMKDMPIFANRHCLFVVSDRGEVSSYLTNLGFRIQIMKLIISDRGSEILVYFTPCRREKRQTSFQFFLQHMTGRNERVICRRQKEFSCYNIKPII